MSQNTLYLIAVIAAGMASSCFIERQRLDALGEKEAAEMQNAIGFNLAAVGFLIGVFAATRS